MDTIETIYEHEHGKNTFTVTAGERWSATMIKNLKEKYPEEVDIVCVNPDGSMVAHLPFSWLRIVPKKQIEWTDEQKEAAAERLKIARKNKKEKANAN